MGPVFSGKTYTETRMWYEFEPSTLPPIPCVSPSDSRPTFSQARFAYLHVLMNDPLRHGLRLPSLRVAEQFVQLREAFDPPPPRLGGGFNDPHVLAEVPVEIELREGSLYGLQLCLKNVC